MSPAHLMPTATSPSLAQELWTTLPSTLITIGAQAFYHCEKLNSDIIIPASVTLIDNEAFKRCYLIDNIYCYPNPAELTWTGASNWSGNAVPPAGSNVYIEANVIIPSGYTANVGQIAIAAGNTITIADRGQLKASNSVTATVNKSISGWTVNQSQGAKRLIAGIS